MAAAAEGEEEDTEDRFEVLIHDGCGDQFNGDKSRAVMWVIIEMFRRGHSDQAIVDVLTERSNGISEHIYEHGGRDPDAFAERQVERVKKKVKLATDQNGAPIKSIGNIRLAYGRLLVEAPRQFVIAGTTNSSRYLIGHVRADLIARYNKDTAWEGRCDAFARVSDHIATAIGHQLHERGRLDRPTPRVMSVTGAAKGNRASR